MLRVRKARSSGPSARDAADLPGRDAAAILRWCRDVVARTGELEAGLQALSDAGLAARTGELRGRIEAGQPLDSLLPEAFAVVREAAVRTLGQRHHDVQVMGGAVLHLGKVAEMRTGEGKTLTATLPAYLHALAGGGVHIMTANEYLARRDAEWMTPVYRFLGLDVGLLDPGLPAAELQAARTAAYAADVTYGDSAEFCYDYLRDHMVLDAGERVQRGLDFAIVDEADLILIDLAKATPQIMADIEQPDLPFAELAAIAAGLRPDVDYSKKPGRREVLLTDEGARSAEERLGIASLYDAENLGLAHGLQKALEAAVLYERDRDYIVTDGRVQWLDPVSGRANPALPGDGLGQAIEVKEGLPPRNPRRVLAVITSNEYLRQYRKLAAMTGTAEPDAASYQAIYGLDVVVIPTNSPVIRLDHADLHCGTAAVKLTALTEETARRHATGQPVLIGAASISEADALSAMLAEREVPHEVLTAKNHASEAAVIAGAGTIGAVTVIAKMAGRGVDIVLGGPRASQESRDAVADAGGLCVLGAERSESRRVELLLRGRAGRQGDPGESRFYLSCDDEATIRMLGTAGAARNQRLIGNSKPFSSSVASRSIDRCQARQAAAAARMLAELLRFDAVLAGQRRDQYAERDRILCAEDLSGWLQAVAIDLAMDRAAADREAGVAPDPLAELVRADVAQVHASRVAEVGETALRSLVRRVTLLVMDARWRDHLEEMAALRDGIGLRAIGGRSPLAEYQREAAALFARSREQSLVDVVDYVYQGRCS